MTLNTTNLGASTPLPEGGKSLRIPIERRAKASKAANPSIEGTIQRPLRAL
jgi:hypothetical protein